MGNAPFSEDDIRRARRSAILVGASVFAVVGAGSLLTLLTRPDAATAPTWYLFLIAITGAGLFIAGISVYLTAERFLGWQFMYAESLRATRSVWFEDDCWYAKVKFVAYAGGFAGAGTAILVALVALAVATA